MNEIYKKAVYVVDKDNEAAWSAIIKLANQCVPGAVIPVTHDEFEAIKDGLIMLLPPETICEGCASEGATSCEHS